MKTSSQLKKSSSSQGLKVGESLPDLKVQSTLGEIQLSAFRGKKIVLYFYPKDNTPGCTLEGQQFSQLKAEFAKKNTVVIGVSRDSIRSHESFREKQCLSIDLISDADEKLCQVLDVIKQKNMYGRMVMGVERSTFLFSEDQKLIQEWRQVKADGHAQSVLESIS